MAQSSTSPSSGQTSSLIQLRTVATNVLLGVMFAFFAYAAFLDWQKTGRIQALILALQELLIVGLVITRRRSVEESRAAWDWIIAVVGTAAPLLQRPAPTLDWLVPIGLGFQILGGVLATIAVGSLGRSFGIVAANRGIQTTGFYRFVRHPLYGSYLIGYLGFLLGNLSILNIALIAATFVCQYLRAVAEERILSRDPDYRAYKEHVRYRFIPFIF